MDQLLKAMHKGVRHTGRVPAWAKVVGRDNDRVEDLRVRLEEAVAAERYEEAGRLRDEIRQLTPPETAV
jgi:protein arginine kinase activator